MKIQKCLIMFVAVVITSMTILSCPKKNLAGAEEWNVVRSCVSFSQPDSWSYLERGRLKEGAVFSQSGKLSGGYIPFNVKIKDGKVTSPRDYAACNRDLEEGDITLVRWVKKTNCHKQKN